MSRINKSAAALALIASLTGCVTSPDAKPQSNRAVIDRYFHLVDAKQPEKLGDVETAKVVYRLPLGIMDGAVHAQVLKSFGAAFPNFKHTLARCVEAGDLVSCEGNFTGDHTGPLAMADGSTLSATGKHVDFPIAAFARIQNGKLAEFNGYFDVLGFLGQLGVGPAAAKK